MQISNLGFRGFGHDGMEKRFQSRLERATERFERTETALRPIRREALSQCLFQCTTLGLDSL